jgi:hypothetical protein
MRVVPILINNQIRVPPISVFTKNKPLAIKPDSFCSIKPKVTTKIHTDYSRHVSNIDDNQRIASKEIKPETVSEQQDEASLHLQMKQGNQWDSHTIWPTPDLLGNALDPNK